MTADRPVQKLTSSANPLLKEVRRTLARGELTRHGCVVAESFHLLEEALRSPSTTEAVIAAESACARTLELLKGHPGIKIFTVPDRLYQSLSATPSPQGVAALVRLPCWRLEDVLRRRALAIVLDRVQDPGNAGTILRAAEAFGSTGVIFLRGSVHPGNPKAVRASAGSLFRIPTLPEADSQIVGKAAATQKLRIFTATPNEGISPRQAKFDSACIIVLGSEGSGIRSSWRGAIKVRIPTEHVESLNVLNLDKNVPM